METWFQNEGFHQYMILGTEYEDMDRFEMNMLMRYEGKQLLPLDLQCENGSVKVSYEISGSISIQEKFRNKEMNHGDLQELFRALWECCEELEEYLLPLEGMLLQPEYIYYHPAQDCFHFCYCPGYRTAFQKEFLTLVEFCMKRTRHQDSQAVLFIYGLYRLLQEGSVEREELQRYLTQFVAEPEEQMTPGQQLQKPFATETEPKTEPEAETLSDEPISFIKKEGEQGVQFYLYGGLSIVALGISIVFAVCFFVISRRETDLKICIISMIATVCFGYGMIKCRKKKIPVVLAETETETRKVEEIQRVSESEETRVLDTSMAINDFAWKLESQGEDHPDLVLQEFPAILGRAVGEADHVITGVGISRKHAELYRNGECLFVEDLSSTNGTYVNSVRLQAGVPMQLSDGDLLMLGPYQYLVRRLKTVLNGWTENNMTGMSI